MVIELRIALPPIETGLNTISVTTIPAKHAVTGLTRQMALGLGKFDVSVNGVAPGFVISSPVTEAFWNDMGLEIQRRHIESIFLRRTENVGDIAGPVIFLASDLAGCMSGQVLAVNGGKL